MTAGPVGLLGAVYYEIHAERTLRKQNTGEEVWELSV